MWSARSINRKCTVIRVRELLSSFHTFLQYYFSISKHSRQSLPHPTGIQNLINVKSLEATLTIPLTYFSPGGFPFLLAALWLDVLFGCPPGLLSGWPSLTSLACLKSPWPPPRPQPPPPRLPPRPRWFGCLREVWGLAAQRKKSEIRDPRNTRTLTHTHTHSLTATLRQVNVSEGHSLKAIFRATDRPMRVQGEH